MSIAPQVGSPPMASGVSSALGSKFKVALRRSQHFAKTICGRAAWSVFELTDNLGIGPLRRVVDLDGAPTGSDLPIMNQLAPAIRTSIALPDIHPADAVGSSLWGMFETASFIATEPVRWFVDRDVDVCFPHSLAQSRGRIYKQGMLSEYALFNPKFAIPAETMRFRRRQSLDAGILFSMPWHYNFYHWMIDILPRLQILEMDSRLDHLPILVPAGARGFVRQTLAMTPFSDRVMFIDDGVTRVRELYFLAPLAEPCKPSPLAAPWLNRTFDLDALSPRETPARIFVTRNDALTRYILNDDEIRGMAERWGYTVLSMTDYPLLEQARLMRQADVVVGVHGANLTMTAFCRPGTMLAEIFENASGHAIQRSPSFFQMGRLNGLHYGFMAGTKKGNGTFVDVGEFERLLRAIDRMREARP